MEERPNAAPIRVLIVDDHAMVRRGLRSLLSSYADICVVGEAGDGVSALREAAELIPHVILLDIQMYGVNGIEIASQILHSVPTAKLIILSAYDNEEYVLGAFRAGVHAYLLKNSSDETVVETIREVQQGKHILSPSLTDQVLRQFHVLAQANADQIHRLGEDEVRVLARLADGATIGEIAREIHWSERTVKRKIEEITERLGAHNRSQAVAIAIREGLI